MRACDSIGLEKIGEMIPKILQCFPVVLLGATCDVAGGETSWMTAAPCAGAGTRSRRDGQRRALPVAASALTVTAASWQREAWDIKYASERGSTRR